MMKEQIKKLKKSMNHHYTEARKYKEAIEALQKVCEHNWKDMGHGHNSTFYECTICGKEDDW